MIRNPSCVVARNLALNVDRIWGVMIDWSHNEKILLEESEPIVRALLSRTRKEGDELAAIGYVFEIGRGQLEFDLCANTRRCANERIAAYAAEYPDDSMDEVRWNSGDFDYPSGVSEHFGGWSDTWWGELSRFDQLAEASPETAKLIYEGISDICCKVLAELASKGVIEDWSNLDFNIADLLDEIPVIKGRDEIVRNLILACS